MTGRRTGLITAGAGLVVVGVIAVICGLLIGSKHVRTTGATGEPLQCGSALSPNSAAVDLDNLRRGFLGEPPGNPCSGPIHNRRVLTYSLLVGGGVVAVLSLVALLIPGLVVRSGPARPFVLDDETVGSDA